MSGIFDKKLYDDCQIKLKLGESTKPSIYNLYPGAYENDLNNQYCKKNTNSTISNKWDSIGKRTDIESELIQISKRGTNCVSDKHKPCTNANDITCNPGVAANPYICNRDIVPTNMIKPISCGF